MQRARAAACVLLYAQLRADRLSLSCAKLSRRTGVARLVPAGGRCCGPDQKARAETPTGCFAVAKPARSRANAGSRLYAGAICLCVDRVAPGRGFSRGPWSAAAAGFQRGAPWTVRWRLPASHWRRRELLPARDRSLRARIRLPASRETFLRVHLPARVAGLADHQSLASRLLLAGLRDWLQKLGEERLETGPALMPCSRKAPSSHSSPSPCIVPARAERRNTD